ncbi:MAG: phospholipase D family protein [Acidobacteria bacterium]|nr:phospholipase D family protein [Acidobacteriota bacterium]
MLGFGPRGIRRRLLRVKRALTSWFTTIPGLRAFRGYRGPEQRSLAPTPDRPTHLDRRLERATRELTAEESGVALLPDGVEALAIRLALVDLAGRSLDVQTYIWDLDATGRRALSHLVAAADRGLRVRLLLDDTSTFRDERAFVALDRHPNVHVRFFNPFFARTNRGFLRRLFEFLADFRRLHRRMHVKSWIADGAFAVLGGRNVADAYYDARSDLNFRDLDLLLAGDAVREAAAGFDAHWNSRWAVPVPHVRGKGRARLGRLRARLREFASETESGIDPVAPRRALEATLGRLESAPVEIVADPPEKLESEAPSAIALRLIEETEPLTASLDVESAYLVLPPAGVEILAALVQRGVRVRLLTNSLATTDVVAAHAGYRAVRDQLLDAGVEIYELRPAPPGHPALPRARRRSRASLHSKAASFDRRRAYVGSLNLDARSIRWNTEIGVFVACPALAGELATRLEEGYSREWSWRVERDPAGRSRRALVWLGPGGKRLDREPEASLWRRLSCSVLGMLPIRDLL